MTPKQLHAWHKHVVMSPGAGISPRIRGGALLFRLLIAEGIDRNTVMSLCGVSRTELATSLHRYTSATFDWPVMDITQMRTAWVRLKSEWVHEALKAA